MPEKTASSGGLRKLPIRLTAGEHGLGTLPRKSRHLDLVVEVFHAKDKRTKEDQPVR
jgi:hypothetical protein